jgi:glucosamine--fructose-6-phosphate aminotransferase (isomerizing)
MSFLEEIKQQPQALRDWATWSANPGLVKPVQDVLARHAAERIIFTGMGSSLFAGMIAVHQLHMQGLNSLALDTQEALSHYVSLFSDDTLIIIISQSGTSPEPVQLARRLQGRYLAITNQPASPLAQLACCAMPLCGGEEHHTTSKTYTNSIAAAQTLASWILHDHADLHQIWLSASGEMNRLIDEASRYIPSALALIRECTMISIIGSGASFANACQAQLVLTEVAHVQANAYTPGQFLHGPVEAIDQNYGAILLDTPDMKEKTGIIMAEILRYGGKVICISTQNHFHPSAGVTCIPIQTPFPDRSHILEMVPIELLAHEAGLARGLQPGRLLRTQK